MRFSTWEYSQIEIMKFNIQNPELALDPTDLFIFHWFHDFALRSKKKPDKNSKNNSGMWSRTCDGVEYYYVKYEAIINDFPMLGVISQKSIQRRFEKYVKGKLLDKKMIHKGRHGNFPYFAFTGTYFSLLYDNENPEHMDQNFDCDEYKKSVTSKSETSEDCTDLETESIQKNDNIKAVEDKSVQFKKISKDNNVQSKDISPDKSVQSKTTSMDNNVQSKGVSPDKSVQSLIYNSNTSFKNSTASSSENSMNKNNSDNKSGYYQNLAQKEAEAVFKLKLKEIFNADPEFNPDPFPVFARRLQDNKINFSETANYLIWINSVLTESCKNPDKYLSYFYKSFTQPNYIIRYKKILEDKIKKSAEIKARQIICPVCGLEHDSNDYVCPNEDCRFSREDLKNQNLIKHSKAIYQLKLNDKTGYDRYCIELNKLYEQIPLIERVQESSKKKEYEEKLSEIESRFLKI